MKDIKDYATDTEVLYGKSYPRRHPGTILEGLSSKHTSCIIAESFKQSFFDKLPPELRRRIAGFVGPCWYLAVLGEAHRLIDCVRQSEKDLDEELDLDEDLWISRIVCQDHWYLSQISNMPIEATEGMEIFHIQPPQTIHKIIASTDQLGVRWIQFLDRETTPTQDQSPWYEIYDVKDFEPRLWVVRGRLIIKRIEIDNDEATRLLPSTWTSPNPPIFHPLKGICQGDLQEAQLHHMKLGPQVEGILVVRTGAYGIFGIHNFSGRNKAFWEFLEQVHARRGPQTNPSLYWFYFPLNDQEDILKVWDRRLGHSDGRTNFDGLIVSASISYLISRTDRLGTNILREGYDIRSVSGIIHDGMDLRFQRMTVFGVTCHSPHDGETRAPVPVRYAIGPPRAHPRDDLVPWYMTKATLRGVTKVQVCRDRTQSHHPCLGILMFYADGHIESNGQIRWDYGLDEEICGPFVVASGAVNEKDTIKDIRNAEDPVVATVHRGEWKPLPSQGILAWWFSELGDRLVVYYE
ncbi:hypothetical protein BO83DRAFT_447567 [Aspergillus eucalypticola CBS 122712]|uniref:Uncharacterized protein n=1 Tax=Aspergillus eucalypticola (strain CBS 122712 / IBT 29274) TaxID=1448314 RepID=A0A317VBX4_ASPEC|nr:uncharacterized protein BO83DRAFT_447567 [Aspergillus eucalypticola CBS 122712]PWY70741.1 hypothetical protein BO83DRAFT_447567 [Aspergillus eucalypticola CBS 122712]